MEPTGSGPDREGNRDKVSLGLNRRTRGGKTIPIKWSAVKVDQAMNEVEARLDEAQLFLEQAVVAVQRARRIPDLPSYVDNRLARLELDIRERYSRLKADVESIRDTIPDGAIEVELHQSRHGRQPSLI
jgi:hypothetical protein